MKKIKQFSLKAMLLTILAALTIGFTGCSDELSGDQTQGKPGYLTVNVKTLKPNQTKHAGDGADDIQNIKNLNIFVVNNAGNVLVHRYYDYVTMANGTPWTVAPSAGVASIEIAVNELAVDDYVVAVANYGSSITATTIGAVEALDITTVRDVTANGLHMTGRADIITGVTGYQSQVKIAPVESKITVDWNFGTELTGSYIVTGVYVVNAITHTKMPLIRNNTYDGTDWDAVNIAPNGYINYTTNIAAPTRTAATGYTGTILPTNYDFNRYAIMSTTEATLLSDVNATGLTGFFHYYLGENYSSATTALGEGALIDNANATAAHANTIVIIEATPTAAGIALYGNAVRYYTYEFDKNSTGTDSNPLLSPNYSGITEGFSVRRKTNYNLTFNLNSIGSTTPFTRSRILSVTVTAEGWDDATTTPTF